MAAKELTFDDLDPVTPESENDDDDVPTRNLDPGDELVAEIRHLEREVGRFGNTVLHLTEQDGTLCKLWSNASIDRALDAADAGVGDTIGIRKGEDAQTFENDEGEEQEFYPFEVAVSEADS